MAGALTLRQFFFLPTKTKAPRFHRLVVDAYAGEKRVIALRGAYHNTPIEGPAVADLYQALDWLLPRSD